MKRAVMSAACLLFVLIAACADAASPAYPDTIEFPLLFSNYGQRIWENYKNGEFGDEMYMLASGGTWGGHGDVAICKSGNDVQLTLYQDNGRRKTRLLTKREFQAFEGFITGRGVDALPDWDTYAVSDGVEYLYLHFSRHSQSAFYMNNPQHIESRSESQKVYSELVSLFFDLTEKGSFKTWYAWDGVEGKILIDKEDYFVESVWKSGEDFRVLIKDVENSTYRRQWLDWYTYENGGVGRKTDEPDGVTLQNPWSDIPDAKMVWSGEIGALQGYQNREHLNNYPWQIQWKSYYVRVLEQYGSPIRGLWLTKQGEEPLLIAEGTYAAPVVIPGTDWVVCSRADNGWANPNIVVKINLATFEETVIDLPPSGTMEPVVMIRGKLLIMRERQAYLYDASEDTLEEVYGDFFCFSHPIRAGYGLTGRFLQETSVPDTYYVLGDQRTIGVFDANTFTFTELAEYPIYIMDMTKMWVDEENDVVYAAVNGDLLELPLGLK